jgi:hypothetical protein
MGTRAVRDHHPGRELVHRRTVVSSSGLIANSRDADILGRVDSQLEAFSLLR